MLHAYLQLTMQVQRCPRVLRWLAAFTLLVLIALGLVWSLAQWGVFYEAELILVQFFASHPFYMSAQEAQVELLGDGANVALCSAIALYSTLVLLRERRGWVQGLIVMLGLLVMIVASASAVFWGGILNLSAAMSSLFISWVLAASAHELGEIHQKIIQRAQASREHEGA